MVENRTGTTPASTTIENLPAELYIDNLPHWVHLLGFGIYLTLLLLALIANTVVLFVFYRVKEIRNVTNNLLCNMVAANLLFAAQTPLEGTSVLHDSWDVGNVPCKIHRLLLYTFYNVSIMSLTVISIERYLAICSPMRFNSLEKKSTKIILSVWVASFALSLPQVFVSSSKTTHGKMVCIEQHSDEDYLALFLCYHVPYFLCLYLIPLGILTVTYVRVSKKLYSVVARFRQRSRFDICGAVQMRKNTIRMLLVVIVVFFLCLTPFKVVELLHVTPVLRSHDPFGILNVSVSMIAFSFALLNPLVCTFMSREFRKATKKAFKCSLGLKLRLGRLSHAESDVREVKQNTTTTIAEGSTVALCLNKAQNTEQEHDINKKGLHNEGFTFETLERQNTLDHDVNKRVVHNEDLTLLFETLQLKNSLDHDVDKKEAHNEGLTFETLEHQNSLEHDVNKEGVH